MPRPKIAAVSASKKPAKPRVVAKTRGNTDDIEYDRFVAEVRSKFTNHVSVEKRNVFRTNVGDLFSVYLNAFPAKTRQFHNCNTCRDFINRYGGLVYVDDAGATHSAMWEGVEPPTGYKAAIAAMLSVIRRATITGAFVGDQSELGKAHTGEWSHYAVSWASPKANSSRLEAEAAHRHETMIRAIEEFPDKQVAMAVGLLEADALYRSESVLGPAKFLQELQTKVHWTRIPIKRSNIIWNAVATAPEGFCHPRTSMIGTLLGDLAAGYSLADAANRFKAKMHPLAYQRPTEPAKAGTIKVAEALVAEKGWERSFARRFARLDEVPLLWRPRHATEPAADDGVFSHLRQRPSEPDRGAVDGGSMSWEKFASKILPTVRLMQLMVPGGSSNFCAYTTAVHSDAPPILQWDSEESRNPVAWYVYNNGTLPRQWGLDQYSPVEVVGVAAQPDFFPGSPPTHRKPTALLILRDCVDSKNNSLGLFPEYMRSELHSVRSVVEAHSNSQALGGADDGQLCSGLRISERGVNREIELLCVIVGGASVRYRIRSWD